MQEDGSAGGNANDAEDGKDKVDTQATVKANVGTKAQRKENAVAETNVKVKAQAKVKE